MKRVNYFSLMFIMFMCLIGEVSAAGEVLENVPNTFSMNSTILIAIAMFDIALGIGILVYVKKNKAKK